MSDWPEVTQRSSHRTRCAPAAPGCPDSTGLAGWCQCQRLSEPLLPPSQALPKRKCGQLWGRKPKVKYKPCTFRHPGMEGMGGRGGRADPAPLPCSPVPGLALEGCHWAAPALRAWTAGASVRCSGPCGEGIKLGPATLTRPPHRYLQRAFHVPAWCGAPRSGRWQRITGISWDVPQVSGCSAEL